MDMYQKREMRKNKKLEEKDNNFGSNRINWDIRTYSKITLNLDK